MFIVMINDPYFSLRDKGLLFSGDTKLYASHSDSVIY